MCRLCFSLLVVTFCVFELSFEKVVEKQWLHDFYSIHFILNVFFFFSLLCVVTDWQSSRILFARIERNKMRLLRKNGNNLSTILESKQWKASLYWSQFFILVGREFFSFSLSHISGTSRQRDDRRCQEFARYFHNTVCISIFSLLSHRTRH